VIPERTRPGVLRSGEIAGYSDNYLHVIFEGSEELIGEMCKVRITEAGVNHCRGVLVSHSRDDLSGEREAIQVV